MPMVNHWFSMKLFRRKILLCILPYLFMMIPLLIVLLIFHISQILQTAIPIFSLIYRKETEMNIFGILAMGLQASKKTFPIPMSLPENTGSAMAFPKVTAPALIPCVW